MTESVDVLVAGAGPAGLRAAQVLAEAGREVLVVERQPRIGPKTCAGALSPKTVRELRTLGLPDDLGLTSLPARVELLIGPEGGLDDDELHAAAKAGFTPVRLGPRVLRTETAAVAALSVLQALWGDLQ